MDSEMQIATKQCNSCHEFKMIATEFVNRNGYGLCKACRKLTYLKTREKTTKQNGKFDTRLAWKNRNFSIKKRIDIRDSILQGDAIH